MNSVCYDSVSNTCGCWVGAVCCYLCRQRWLAWVRCSSPSVCLSLCQERNSKTKKNQRSQSVQTLVYPRNDMVLGFHGHRIELGLGLGLRQQQYGVGSNSMSAFEFFWGFFIQLLHSTMVIFLLEVTVG